MTLGSPARVAISQLLHGRAPNIHEVHRHDAMRVAAGHDMQELHGARPRASRTAAGQLERRRPASIRATRPKMNSPAEMTMTSSMPG